MGTTSTAELKELIADLYRSTKELRQSQAESAKALERPASKRGLFVFLPSGEVMTLANPPGFKPKAF